MMETYKWAVVIHVQYTFSTRATVMGSRWLGFWAVVTESIIFKVTFPYSGVASPHQVWWCASTTKCWKAEKGNGSYGQDCYNDRVKNPTKKTARKGNGIDCPHPSNCTKKWKKKYMRKVQNNAVDVFIFERVSECYELVTMKLTRWL